MEPTENFERNWGAEEWRAPTLAQGDTLLYSECGRIVKAETYGHGRNGIDYRSHYFTVVTGEHNYGTYLLVKHGGGEERIKIDYSSKRVAQFFEPLDSTERYLLMHMLHSLYRDTKREADEATAATYRKAFAEDRLRKRKNRGQASCKVWIEREPIKAAA